MAGKLFVVATPLGNLDDLTPRARDTLRSVEVIACEDTRRTTKLLARFGIDARLLSCHKFNEPRRIEGLLGILEEGSSVALVSDGGTPGISDPGALLVRAALDAGIDVCPIPGPSAVAALLSASGMTGDRYVFEGFLPHRAGERRKRLRALRDETRTVVLFETPHRVRGALTDIAQVLGPRRVVLGRELTKLHETLLAGTAEQIAERLGNDVRGEITLAIEARTDDGATDEPDVDGEARHLLSVWNAVVQRHPGDRRAALREAARELGLKRPELQRRLDELDGDE